MNNFESPDSADLARALQLIATDELTDLKIARNGIAGRLAGRGMHHSSAHAMEVYREIDKRFRGFLSKAMEAAAPYVDRLGPAKDVTAIARPIIETFCDAALAEIPDVVNMRSDLIKRYRPEFGARIDSTLRDFEIGQIGGKRFDHSAEKARPLHRVNDTDYVDKERIEGLKAIQHPDFDLRRLIKICEELNSCWQLANYFAVPDLVRTVMDHIPPVFGGKSFAFVKANHGDRTFKEHMERLDDSLRLVADASLHRHIRKSETLPTASQVNFAADLDVLLGEVIAKLARL